MIFRCFRSGDNADRQRLFGAVTTCVTPMAAGDGFACHRGHIDGRLRLSMSRRRAAESGSKRAAATSALPGRIGTRGRLARARYRPAAGSRRRSAVASAAAAAPGSDAPVIGLPMTSKSAPSRSASCGVATLA